MSLGTIFLWRITLGGLFAMLTVYLSVSGHSATDGLMASLTFKAILGLLTLAFVIAAMRQIGPGSTSSPRPEAPSANTMSESDIDTLIARYAAHPVEQRKGPVEPQRTRSATPAARPAGQVERRSGFGRRGTDVR